MKIALLNMPVDTNYGGMLQRYALTKVLEGMGHDVVHLNMRFPIDAATPRQKFVRTVKRVVGRIRGQYKGAIRAEHWDKQRYDHSCALSDLFYNKYINHTSYITRKSQLAKMCRDVDVLVIGSDQVWRKDLVQHYGMETYFGDFLPQSSSAVRIVYGASFGIEEDVLMDSEKFRLLPLYQKFSAVSVREDSGLALLDKYGWISPRAKQVLDPTLLLSDEDYSRLIDTAETRHLEGNMLCYFLDPTPDKNYKVSKLASGKNMIPVFLSIDGKTTIEQWLRSFRDAELIVTDSYHGLVFSIIMHKPICLFMNKWRGNARFDSLLRLCGIHGIEDYYEGCPQILHFDSLRDSSLVFLKKALETV